MSKPENIKCHPWAKRRASCTLCRDIPFGPALAGFFRTARADDKMRHFLIGAVEYLSSFTDENIEVPVSIIRAMNDVERIAQIEESALLPEKQDVIRYCTLQIERLAGRMGESLWGYADSSAVGVTRVKRRYWN